MGELTEIYDDLKDTGKKMRKDETKRWQVNYDFTVARMEAQIAFLYEFQSMLGQMRKELPPKEAAHNGWMLASTETLTGDSAGKKMAASSRKIPRSDRRRSRRDAVGSAGRAREIYGPRPRMERGGCGWSRNSGSWKEEIAEINTFADLSFRGSCDRETINRQAANRFNPSEN